MLRPLGAQIGGSADLGSVLKADVRVIEPCYS
jgi:hypothetical protein